jgi:antitoxin ParD1/3/4
VATQRFAGLLRYARNDDLCKGPLPETECNFISTAPLTNIVNLCHYREKGRFNIMATMNVSLPDPMKAWVESQVEGGQYGNTSDYVRDLIRRDQNDREQTQALQEAITKGIESGISDRTMKDILKAARSKAKSAKHAV